MNIKRLLLSCLLFCLLIPTFTHAKIVFNSTQDGISGLYVMDDDGSNVQRLTVGPNSWSDFWPEWSPDGKQIAFDRYLGNDPIGRQIFELYIINSDGTGEHRLTNEEGINSSPTWSPDGKYIAFSSNRLAKLGESEFDIWRINIATKEVQRLTRMADWTITYPQWSPDGKYIAYQRGVDIYLMLPDGRGRHTKIGKGNRPEWSLDSQSVVYYEKRRDALGNLITEKVVIYSIKNRKRQILDTPDPWVIHTACFMGPKHVLIAGSHWDEENPNRDKFDIYRYHLVTGEIVNLTNTPAVDDIMMDWISDDVLSVSPQGKIAVLWGTLKQ